MRKKIQFTREASGEVQAREAQADPAGEEVQPHGAPQETADLAEGFLEESPHQLKAAKL